MSIRVLHIYIYKMKVVFIYKLV